jgi:hypothetical protein
VRLLECIIAYTNYSSDVRWHHWLQRVLHWWERGLHLVMNDDSTTHGSMLLVYSKTHRSVITMLRLAWWTFKRCRRNAGYHWQHVWLNKHIWRHYRLSWVQARAIVFTKDTVFVSNAHTVYIQCIGILIISVNSVCVYSVLTKPKSTWIAHNCKSNEAI